MIDISSRENSHLKRWLDLDSSRGLKKHSEFFLMGEKLIAEYLKNPSIKLKAEIIHEGLTPLSTIPHNYAKLGRVPLFKLSKPLFNEVDFIGTHYNLFVLELPELENFDISQSPEGMEVITPLGDPSNLGALIRSAAAFGASKVILSSEAANPYLPKSIKASAGAVLFSSIYKSSLSVAELANKSASIHALDMNGENIEEIHWPKNLRLLIGEEGRGLPGDLVAKRICVPTGKVESLNATVAASLALYSWHLAQKK